jgi:nicotinamidase-related amidase
MQHRVACWAGRSFVFAPETTAVMAIDMQKDFLAPKGMAGIQGEEIGNLAPVVPRLRRLLAAARRAGLCVIHTREGFAADLSDVSPLRRERGTVGEPGPLGRFLIRGEAGQDFVDELRPLDGEAVFDKPGFSAFFKTALEDHLRRQGVTHLILTGVTTQCCVQSTLRSAVDRGFYCLILEDCCAALDPRHHDATFETIQSENHLFGWVSDSGSLIGCLAGVRENPAASR